MIQNTFRPIKCKKFYNFKISNSECIICWEENIPCYILPCFNTHVVCTGCIIHVELCPFCRIKI